MKTVHAPTIATDIDAAITTFVQGQPMLAMLIGAIILGSVIYRYGI